MDQKRISNTLNFKIQTKLDNDRPINPHNGINKWTVSVFKNEIKEKKPSFISVLYRTKYSAYNKLYTLQKYIDIINCKYAANLKINFHYNSLKKKYTFILYFGDTDKNLSYDQIQGYIKTWERMKNNGFSVDPSLQAI